MAALASALSGQGTGQTGVFVALCPVTAVSHPDYHL